MVSVAQMTILEVEIKQMRAQVEALRKEQSRLQEEIGRLAAQVEALTGKGR